MAKITLKGNPIKTIGSLPKVGKKAPKFSLIKSDLSKTKLKDFKKHIYYNNMHNELYGGSVQRYNEIVHKIKDICSIT